MTQPTEIISILFLEKNTHTHTPGPVHKSRPVYGRSDRHLRADDRHNMTKNSHLSASLPPSSQSTCLLSVLHFQSVKLHICIVWQGKESNEHETVSTDGTVWPSLPFTSHISSSPRKYLSPVRFNTSNMGVKYQKKKSQICTQEQFHFH